MIEDLRVEQALTCANQTWQPAGEVVIQFTLGKPADVDVTISRRGFGELTMEGIFNGDTVPVKRLKMKLEKGAQRLVWDGLDEKGQVVAEQTRTPIKAGDKKLPDQPLTNVPVNRFRISVQALGETQALSFERVAGSFDPTELRRDSNAYGSRGGETYPWPNQHVYLQPEWHPAHWKLW